MHDMAMLHKGPWWHRQAQLARCQGKRHIWQVLCTGGSAPYASSMRQTWLLKPHCGASGLPYVCKPRCDTTVHHSRSHGHTRRSKAIARLSSCNRLAWRAQRCLGAVPRLHVHKDLVLRDVGADGVLDAAAGARLRLELGLKVVVRVRIVLRRVHGRRLAGRLGAERAPRRRACADGTSSTKLHARTERNQEAGCVYRHLNWRKQLRLQRDRGLLESFRAGCVL